MNISSSKGIILVAVVAAVVAVFAMQQGGNVEPELSTQTVVPAPESEGVEETRVIPVGWSEYRDATFGISFVYPKEWTLIEQNLGDGDRRLVSVTSDTQVNGSTFKLVFDSHSPAFPGDGNVCTVVEGVPITPRGLEDAKQIIYCSLEKSAEISYLHVVGEIFDAGSVTDERFFSHNGKRMAVRGSFSIQRGGGPPYYELGQYKEFDEVQTAMEIIGSLEGTQESSADDDSAEQESDFD